MTTATNESSLRYTRREVNPELAEAILTINTDNRPVDQSRVNKYAKQMASGLWKETSAELIQIAGVYGHEDCRLIDGQHRLRAIMQSGVTLLMTIVDGCDASTFDVIDTGKTRTHNDVFAIDGMPKGTAPLARIVYLYDKMFDRDWRSTKTSNVSQTELLQWAADKKEVLSTAAAMGKQVKKSIKPLGTTAGAVMAILDLFGGVSCETTFEVFYRPMIDLVGCDPDSPSLVFYQFIRSAQDSRSETAGPFAVNAGATTENNRKKIIMQLRAARDAIQNLTRKTYRWRDDYQMPDVRQMQKNAVLVREEIEKGATKEELMNVLGITNQQFYENQLNGSN